MRIQCQLRTTNYKKGTKGNLEQENKIIKIKNSKDGFNSRFQMVEGRFSKMEDS